MKEAHRLLRDRTDPHGYPIKSEDILKSIVITDEGGVSLRVRPRMPHCPCCLFDLSLLSKEFLSSDAIKSVEILVVENPGLRIGITPSPSVVVGYDSILASWRILI